MTSPRHLTEDERQSIADGTLDAERARDTAAHLAVCDDCAADVARLRTLMTRIREAPNQTDPLGDLWPAIRARIDQSKIVRLDTPVATTSSGRVRPVRPWVWLASVAASAAVVIIAVTAIRTHAANKPAGDIGPSDSSASFTNVADSSAAYEQEATALLNELQMQRAMMRPQTTASIDRDLRVIDQAIAEVKDALVRDPNNPALRRLLASSYRQKVELLKRATNAS